MTFEEFKARVENPRHDVPIVTSCKRDLTTISAEGKTYTYETAQALQCRLPLAFHISELIGFAHSNLSKLAVIQILEAETNDT